MNFHVPSLLDQAVVEVGATFVRTLSDYHFWIALLVVVMNRDGKRGSLGGWGKYGGLKLRPQAFDLCGGDQKPTLVFKVTTRYLMMSLMCICTVWAFWYITP